MQNLVKLAFITAAVSGTLLASSANAGSSLATSSVVSAVVVGSVVLVPLAIVVQGSTAIGASFANVSRSVSSTPNWTVTKLEAAGPKTKVTLESNDKSTVLVLNAPSAEIAKSKMKVNNTVTAKSLGEHSVSFDYMGQPLGVITDETAGLVYSRKR